MKSLLNSLAKPLSLSLFLAAGSAQSAELIPQIDCSGSIKVLKTSEAFGKADAYGNYQILRPGLVSFKAEVEFAPITAACEDAVSQLGIKPYVKSEMVFQGTLAQGSTNIAQKLADEIVGQTLSYQLVVKANETGPNFPTKILAAKVGPEVKFVGSSDLGPISLSSFASENIVLSSAHAPKAFSSLSDADKLADATLIFNEPKFLANIGSEAGLLESFLKKTLIPEGSAAKKAYLDLVTSALLTKIAPDDQYLVLNLDGDKTIGDLISKLASGPGVSTTEEKAQLLLTFPGVLYGYETCLAEDADVLLGFLSKAQAFQAAWTGHGSSLEVVLEKLDEGGTCVYQSSLNDEMQGLIGSALGKI